jgi:transposase
MWVPPEDVDPVVLHEPTRKSIGLCGAVRAADGRLVTSFEHIFNADIFLNFLKQLLRHRRKDRKILVVVDNARWHHAKKIQPWLKEHRRIIQLEFLPPYSPDLNHIERVWKLTRKLCTHNRYFPEFSGLVDTLADTFYSWSQPNETLRKLCAII